VNGTSLRLCVHCYRDSCIRRNDRSNVFIYKELSFRSKYRNLSILFCLQRFLNSATWLRNATPWQALRPTFLSSAKYGGQAGMTCDCHSGRSLLRRSVAKASAGISIFAVIIFTVLPCLPVFIRGPFLYSLFIVNF